MPFSDLTLDRAFEEFNFSWILDPTLSGGPSQAVLLQLVYAARQGDRSATFELVDTMCCTLREETFECFQKAHGPRPIRYRDWYYSKLLQFLEILVYEQLSVDRLRPDGTAYEPQTDRPWEEGVTILGSAGPAVQDDDVERAFEPGDGPYRAHRRQFMPGTWWTPAQGKTSTGEDVFMPWEENNTMDQRMKFLIEWQHSLESKAELCRRYGISRALGYKWAQRYQNEGPAGLVDRSGSGLNMR